MGRELHTLLEDTLQQALHITQVEGGNAQDLQQIVQIALEVQKDKYGLQHTENIEELSGNIAKTLDKQSPRLLTQADEATKGKKPEEVATAIREDKTLNNTIKSTTNLSLLLPSNLGLVVGIKDLDQYGKMPSDKARFFDNNALGQQLGKVLVGDIDDREGARKLRADNPVIDDVGMKMMEFLDRSPNHQILLARPDIVAAAAKDMVEQGVAQGKEVDEIIYDLVHNSEFRAAIDTGAMQQYEKLADYTRSPLGQENYAVINKEELRQKTLDKVEGRIADFQGEGKAQEVALISEVDSKNASIQAQKKQVRRGQSVSDTDLGTLGAMLEEEAKRQEKKDRRKGGVLERSDTENLRESIKEADETKLRLSKRGARRVGEEVQAELKKELRKAHSFDLIEIQASFIEDFESQAQRQPLSREDTQALDDIRKSLRESKQGKKGKDAAESPPPGTEQSQGGWVKAVTPKISGQDNSKGGGDRRV